MGKGDKIRIYSDPWVLTKPGGRVEGIFNGEPLQEPRVADMIDERGRSHPYNADADTLQSRRGEVSMASLKERRTTSSLGVPLIEGGPRKRKWTAPNIKHRAMECTSCTKGKELFVEVGNGCGGG